MNLKDWRSQNNMSIVALAEILGKSRQAIYGYESGQYTPDGRTLAKIEHVTDGQVTASDWFRGWYDKYRVEKLDGDTDPAADYFVLRLDTDPAARIAALSYAASCRDSKLAAWLRARVHEHMAGARVYEGESAA